MAKKNSDRALLAALRVTDTAKFSLAKRSTDDTFGWDEEGAEAELEQVKDRLDGLQQRLFAESQRSLLVVIQAMDAAGKDGTIRNIFNGLNPAGVRVTSFKVPGGRETVQDYLWRCHAAAPGDGEIGVFNRSHYEETLVVRVNPGYLAGQRLPRRPTTLPELWEERHESIRDAEKHWARNGTVVLKFFLNVSRAEQHQRFLERLEDPDDHWKFNAGDLRESDKWDSYMEAYEAALNETSRPWAPWYAIPADSKSYMRRTVADIIVGTLAGLDLRYPEPSSEERDELARIRAQLQAATGGTDGKDGKDGKNGKNGKK